MRTGLSDMNFVIHNNTRIVLGRGSIKRAHAARARQLRLGEGRVIDRQAIREILAAAG
ncbi:hypothetical protein CHELA1G11_20532 [Hyphomicrobiales bacterium]|nr:hypothetical protein CHELA1G11_20532 [Hyphomicrobiales bacterium]CAH1690664.1 hypothetical protein CHELA1G2_20845 [Hyphomicrobiales bacterium]